MEIFIAWVLFAVLGAVIGSRKNVAITGFICGFLLGPIGLLIVLCLDSRPKCPQCLSRLNGKSNVCPACRSILHWYGSRPSVLKEKMDQDQPIEDEITQQIAIDEAVRRKAQENSRRKASAALPKDDVFDAIIEEEISRPHK